MTGGLGDTSPGQETGGRWARRAAGGGAGGRWKPRGGGGGGGDPSLEECEDRSTLIAMVGLSLELSAKFHKISLELPMQQLTLSAL